MQLQDCGIAEFPLYVPRSEATREPYLLWNLFGEVGLPRFARDVEDGSYPPSVRWMASAIRLAMRFICSSVAASTMTRASGSVPE